MTDNEIIKAFETGVRNCESCSYGITTQKRKVLNLINRQKAEIENLKDELHRAKVVISKHFDYMDSAANEAMKKFGKFLIDKSKDGKICVSDIPDYVKEMTKVEE